MNQKVTANNKGEYDVRLDKLISRLATHITANAIGFKLLGQQFSEMKTLIAGLKK